MFIYTCNNVTRAITKLFRVPRQSAPLMPKTTKSAEVFLGIFFDAQGVVYHRYIPQGHTIKADLHIEIWPLWRTEFERNDQRWQKEDGGSCRLMRPVTLHAKPNSFLSAKNIATRPHPHYSQDLASCDCLFSKLKLNGRYFPNANECEHTADEVLREVAKGSPRIWEWEVVIPVAR